jgi:hypothetical protein
MDGETGKRASDEATACGALGERPTEERACPGTVACVTFSWSVSDWSPADCPSGCGLEASSQRRTVKCLGSDGTEAPDEGPNSHVPGEGGSPCRHDAPSPERTCPATERCDGDPGLQAPTTGTGAAGAEAGESGDAGLSDRDRVKQLLMLTIAVCASVTAASSVLGFCLQRCRSDKASDVWSDSLPEEAVGIAIGGARDDDGEEDWAHVWRRGGAGGTATTRRGRLGALADARGSSAVEMRVRRKHAAGANGGGNDKNGSGSNGPATQRPRRAGRSPPRDARGARLASALDPRRGRTKLQKRYGRMGEAGEREAARSPRIALSQPDGLPEGAAAGDGPYIDIS